MEPIYLDDQSAYFNRMTNYGENTSAISSIVLFLISENVDPERILATGAFLYQLANDIEKRSGDSNCDEIKITSGVTDLSIADFILTIVKRKTAYDEEIDNITKTDREIMQTFYLNLITLIRGPKKMDIFNRAVMEISKEDQAEGERSKLTTAHLGGIFRTLALKNFSDMLVGSFANPEKYLHKILKSNYEYYKNAAMRYY